MAELACVFDFGWNAGKSLDQIFADHSGVERGATAHKNDTADGKFRVHMDRTMTGTINGGGSDATFRTFNGKISIRKKK